MPKVTGSRSPKWAFMSGMHIFAEDGSSYLRRMRIIETPWFGVFLHHIDSPDRDFDPHDHPWTFWSFVVRGGYTERLWDIIPGEARFAFGGYQRKWNTHTWHKMHQELSHKITKAEPGTVTLIFHGKRSSSWGFYTPDGYVDWKTYKER